MPVLSVSTLQRLSQYTYIRRNSGQNQTANTPIPLLPSHYLLTGGIGLLLGLFIQDFFISPDFRVPRIFGALLPIV